MADWRGWALGLLIAVQAVCAVRWFWHAMVTLDNQWNAAWERRDAAAASRLTDRMVGAYALGMAALFGIACTVAALKHLL